MNSITADIKRRALNWGIEINDDQAEKFSLFAGLLLEENRKMNLTAITDLEEVYTKHFLDSMALAQKDIVLMRPGLFGTEELKVADMGSGAGFPGMVLKIVRPSWKLTLFDAQEKRVNFMNMVAKELGLYGEESLCAVHMRAEEAGNSPLYRERFDVCVSRAVASLNVIAEYMLPVVRPGGAMAAYKSADIGDELQEAAGGIAILGGGDAEVLKYAVPETDIERQIVLVQKNGQTPEKYPRRSGMPRKRPL